MGKSSGLWWCRSARLYPLLGIWIIPFLTFVSLLGYIAFLKKRFTRIYMPMAVLCVATAVWMACMGREWFIPLWGNLLLFKMFVPELESSMGGQMWFVSTIIQFYLAWPLIVKLFNIRGG